MKSDELVILVHGFGSKRLWMQFLARRLQRVGFDTRTWSYVSLVGSLRRHADQLRAELEAAATEGRTVHLVAHSMGAIVVRLALSMGRLPHMGRVVMIAPPNHGSPLAAIVAPFVRPVCPALTELSTRSSSFVNQIAPLHDMEVGVIGARFDVLAPLSSTVLDEQTDHISLTATHNSLLFQPVVARHVHAFLTTGRFEHGNDASLS